MTVVKNLNNRVLWSALFLFIFCLPFFIHAEEQPGITVDSILTHVNQLRTQEGLSELVVDKQLNDAAGMHSTKMAELDLLSVSSPELGTPFERVRKSRLTDTNSLVVVAKALNWSSLEEQLGSEDNLSKILSPEMTHMGVGIYADAEENHWVTLHMTERAINFTLFTMNQTTGNPIKRSMKITGNTRHEKIRVLMIFPEDSARDNVEQIIVPDSNGDFEVKLSFGITTGNFSFEFSVSDNGEYKLKNSFSMGIR